MTALFPPARTPEAFEPLRRDDARLRAGVEAVLARHGLSDASVTRFASGSLPVYAVGERLVLKLYPPCYASDFTVEQSALEALGGASGVPAPRVEAAGREGDWAYVLMSRLAGVSLVEAWPDVSSVSRRSLVEDLGRVLARMHALDVEGLDVIRPPWPAFLAGQTAQATERQRRLGLPESWVSQIPSFLESVALEPAVAGVFLHTEVMRDHVFVEQTATGWRLTGLLDFEPAMVGAPEYEFASVGLLVTCGDADLLRRLLLAYGMAPESLGFPLQRRLLAYALLHRYSNLPWYLRHVPPPEGAATLDDLARRWWAL